MEKRKLRIATAKKPAKKKEKASKKTSIPKYLEEVMAKLEDTLKDKIRREIRSCFKDKDLLKMLINNQAEHIGMFNKKIFTLFEKKVNAMAKSLERITEVNEIAEETLRNVLLAIRQNEYLQAWYPAQQGYREMKVVGSHPIIQERKEKAKR